MYGAGITGSERMNTMRWRHAAFHAVPRYSSKSGSVHIREWAMVVMLTYGYMSVECSGTPRRIYSEHVRPIPRDGVATFPFTKTVSAMALPRSGGALHARTRSPQVPIARETILFAGTVRLHAYEYMQRVSVVFVGL